MTPEKAFEQATKFRAKAYFYLFDELSKEIGSDKAEKIFSKAIYRLGIDKSKSFKKESESSADILADEFIKDDIGKKVFQQTKLYGNKNESSVEMKNCPLVEMWKEMDISKEIIIKLCDLAYQIDYGTIEGKGFKLKFPTRISCGDKSCILEIYKR